MEPVVTSGDWKVSVVSHLSNLPLISMEASTSNLTLLDTGVTSKTGAPEGAWAGVVDENKVTAAAAARQIMDIRMLMSLGLLLEGVTCENYQFRFD
jgi:hypothetical protein